MGDYAIMSLSFSDLVQFGKDNGANIVNGMPWSFDCYGFRITHENDKCYLVPNRDYSEYQKFTPGDLLVVYLDHLEIVRTSLLNE